MTDPTTRGAWLVQGELELGPQRRCANCREWYPLEGTFWVQKAYRTQDGPRRHWTQPCRACIQPQWAAATTRYRRKRKAA